MATSIDALAIRRTLNTAEPGTWGVIPAPLGPDGWTFVNAARTRSVVITCAPHDGHEWVHASMTGDDGQVPTYEELALLHRAAFREGWAYQVFVPPAEHVNIHEGALHLWGRLDGRPHLPDFTRGTGSI